jgi:hypothetical protein
MKRHQRGEFSRQSDSPTSNNKSADVIVPIMETGSNEYRKIWVRNNGPAHASNKPVSLSWPYVLFAGFLLIMFLAAASRAASTVALGGDRRTIRTFTRAALATGYERHHKSYLIRTCTRL